MTPFQRSLCGLAAVGMLLAGCAHTDGPFANRDVPCVGDECLPEPFVQFERGRPNIVVDSVGWVFGIPNRILLWNWDVENHRISLETEQHLRQYVAVNGLADTKVRLNQYDPGGEWRRLVDNTRVGAGWRYTFGTLSALGYTVFPGRLFGIDYYNPFTNTVNVYSDVPALGLQGAAYAADVIDRDLPGTYAFSQLIPGVNLVHETITTGDVLDYVDTLGDPELQMETVHVLYPRYGGSVGGAIDYYIPAVSPLFQLGGYVAGHVAGRLETRERAEPDEPTQPSEVWMLGATHTQTAPTPPRAATGPTAADTPAADAGATSASPPHQVANADAEASLFPDGHGDDWPREIMTVGYEEPAGATAQRETSE